MFRLLLTPIALLAALLPSDSQSADLINPEASLSSAPAAQIEVIDAYGVDEFTITLTAKVPVRIVIDGDDDTDLDAFLYDEGGNLIDLDEDLGDLCWLDVTPRWTGEFTVKVVNLGAVSNVYSLSKQ